jgi:hypothetical protein
MFCQQYAESSICCLGVWYVCCDSTQYNYWRHLSWSWKDSLISPCGNGGKSQARDRENYKKLLQTQRQLNMNQQGSIAELKRKTPTSPSYWQTKVMQLWFSTLWTTNRRSYPFLRIHPIGDWPGIPLNRQNVETTLPLKKLHTNRRYRQSTASVRLQTTETIWTSQDKRGFLWHPLLATLSLLPTNTPSFWQDLSANSPGIRHTM